MKTQGHWDRLAEIENYAACCRDDVERLRHAMLTGHATAETMGSLRELDGLKAEYQRCCIAVGRAPSSVVMDL